MRLAHRIAAVAACNPPLFEGPSRKGNVVYPETVDEMLEHVGERRPPMLVLAGDRDAELKLHTHRNMAVEATRYQDSSRIPAAHVRDAAVRLAGAGFDVAFRAIETRHVAPIPDGEVESIWSWLAKHRVGE